jgi:hypothetical protein
MSDKLRLLRYSLSRYRGHRIGVFRFHTVKYSTLIDNSGRDGFCFDVNLVSITRY